MRRFLVLGVLVTSCCLSDDLTISEVRHSGHVPDNAAQITDLIASMCDRDFKGYVEWVDGCFSCGDVVETHGCTDLGKCHFDAKVAYVFNAVWSTLPHEAGHYCFDTDSEEEADAFWDAVIRRYQQGG